MQFLKVFLLPFFFLLPPTLANASDTYDFPYTRDGLVSSLLAAIAQPEEIVAPIKTMVIRTDRDKVPFLEGKSRFRYGILKQNHAAPLVFVIPGTGGLASSNLSLTYAEQLYRLGYHVVTLANPFSWQFALSASRTGLVGYPPDDAEDLYQAMMQLDQHLKAQEKMKITNYGLVAYSLGGLVSAFVGKLDTEKHYFNFKRIVLINPPLNLDYGIDQIDALYAAGDSYTRKQKDLIMGYAINIGGDIMGRPVDSSYYLGLESMLRMNQTELKFLVGNSFREALTDVIFTSQQIRDLGILHTPAGKRSKRMNEIRQISFRNYVNAFLLPQMSKRHGGASNEELMAAADMRSLREYFHRSTSVYLMHNENDFLYHESQLAFIQRNFGPRAFLYPLGGHMGNFWFQKNKDDLARILGIL